MTIEQQLSQESETTRYARQTRNATVFIAAVVGVIVTISLILGIIAMVAVNNIEHSLQNPNASPTCYTPGDPNSDPTLPYC